MTNYHSRSTWASWFTLNMIAAHNNDVQYHNCNIFVEGCLSPRTNETWRYNCHMQIIRIRLQLKLNTTIQFEHSYVECWNHFNTNNMHFWSYVTIIRFWRNCTSTIIMQHTLASYHHNATNIGIVPNVWITQQASSHLCRMHTSWNMSIAQSQKMLALGHILHDFAWIVMWLESYQINSIAPLKLDHNWFNPLSEIFLCNRNLNYFFLRSHHQSMLPQPSCDDVRLTSRHGISYGTCRLRWITLW